MPRLTRNIEAKFLFQRIKKCDWRPFVDADGTITLHIGMTAHRTETRTGPANIAAQQHEIGDFADRDHRMTMLGDAHRPGADDPIRFHIDLCGALQRLPEKSRLVLDFFPRRAVHRSAIGFQFRCMCAEKFPVED